jgi:hypothetical protein
MPYDLNSITQNLEAIRPLSFAQAVQLDNQARDALRAVVSPISGLWSWIGTPDPTAKNRAALKVQLESHIADLTNYDRTPDAPYPRESELRSEALKAFIEANAAGAGGDYQQIAAAQILPDIGTTASENAAAAVKGAGIVLNTVTDATRTVLYAVVIGAVVLAATVYRSEVKRVLK